MTRLSPPPPPPWVDSSGNPTQAFDSWVRLSLYKQLGQGQANLTSEDMIVLEGLDESKPDTPRNLMPSDLVETEKSGFPIALLLGQIEELRQRVEYLEASVRPVSEDALVMGSLLIPSRVSNPSSGWPSQTIAASRADVGAAPSAAQVMGVVSALIADLKTQKVLST